MLKRTTGVVTALFIVGKPMANAQVASGAAATHDNGVLSEAEFKLLADAQIGSVKVALQLTPEQQKSWPAVEEVIRARSEARYRRLCAFANRIDRWREMDRVQLYRERADALTERAVVLKRLVDACQPLHQSLSPDQKMRLRADNSCPSADRESTRGHG